MVGSQREAMGKSFAVKLLNATEIPLRTGSGMRTMGHLREAVEMEVLLPAAFQRYSCMHRSYLEDTPDNLSLEVVLRGTTEGVKDGERYERIVWLLWMAPTDYMAIGRGGLFLESELEQKRARMTRGVNAPSFGYVTLRQYLTLAAMVMDRRSQYRKRNKERTDAGVAAERRELGVRALSSDSSEDGDAV